MSDATVKLGWDNSGARAGAAEALTIAQNLKARTDKALAKVGNAGGLQKGGAGQIAMQFQDIAVQAQMGTNALQIFAQQGSQVLSMFGSGGAIVGGVAAVAGALVFAGQKGNEAFAQLISGSAALNAELSKVIASGSLTQMMDLFGALEQKQSELKNEAEALSGSFMTMAKGVLGVFTGGPTDSERRAQVAAAMAAMEQTRATIMRQTLDLANQELAVQMARLSGNEELAADLQRDLDLQQKIFSIRSSSAPVEVQNQLIANAIKLSEAEENAAAAAKRAEEARERSAARKQLNEAEKAVSTFNETDEQKLNRLVRERDELQQAVVAARGDEVKQIEAATARAQNELAILQTKKTIAERIAAEMKKQADEAERAFNAEAAAQAQRAAQAAQEGKSASVARADAEKQMEILRLRAAGQAEAADAAEKELAVRQAARQIADQQNISYKAALEQAREKMELEEQAAKAGKTGRPDGRIQGFSQAQGGREEAAARAQQRMEEARERIAKSRERGFGGLKELERLNARDANGNRMMPLGKAFERSQAKEDPAVGVLQEIKGVMDQVRAHTERLVVE